MVQARDAALHANTYTLPIAKESDLVVPDGKVYQLKIIVQAVVATG